MKLACAICLFDEDAGNRPADTIINGQAVCIDHTGYVQGGIHSQALITLQREKRERQEASDDR